jgi:hypothetical protein
VIGGESPSGRFPKLEALLELVMPLGRGGNAEAGKLARGGEGGGGEGRMEADAVLGLFCLPLSLLGMVLFEALGRAGVMYLTVRSSCLPAVSKRPPVIRSTA